MKMRSKPRGENEEMMSEGDDERRRCPSFLE
jgi:hypothetical protein